jgi:hypothetical protein
MTIDSPRAGDTWPGRLFSKNRLNTARAGKDPDAVNTQKHQQAREDLFARTAELTLIRQVLAQALSESAARMALTHDDLARTYDAIAASGVSSCAIHAPEHAERARRFAQHERQEQQRWSLHAHND